MGRKWRGLALLAPVLISALPSRPRLPIVYSAVRLARFNYLLRLTTISVTQPAPGRPDTQLTLTAGRERPLPVHANYFHFSRLGADFEMLVCFADAREAVEAVQAHGDNPGPATLTAEVVQRVVLSAHGLQILSQQLTQLIDRIGGPEGLMAAADKALHA